MKIEATKEVFTSGGSLIVYLTNELKMLDVEKGDKIKVTIEKIE